MIRPGTRSTIIAASSNPLRDVSVSLPSGSRTVIHLLGFGRGRRFGETFFRGLHRSFRRGATVVPGKLFEIR